MTTRMSGRSKRIAELNEQLRKEPMNRTLGLLLVTAGVHSGGESFVEKVLAAIAAMTPKDFKKGNDPNGERDFNSFTVGGRACLFKIDYYAKGDPHCGSEDPGDPAKTDRVMTVMLARDY